ncbi:MAG: TIGR04283 family arsenosugar biosynthesis glycosyltransferase [Planctomycetes bacterium]|nr:TIGR04283 family arsenosugar biosynthesis glycosyltransferase [Planctomycetota bacterium]
MTEQKDKTQCSIIIPVINEQETIRPLLESLRQQAGIEQCQIIVVDGDPNGSTLQVIDDPAVTQLNSARGRGLQMNRGAEEARSDNLVFLHADTRLPMGCLSLIDRTLQNPRYVAGAFDLEIASPSPLLKLIARTANLRSRLTRVPYGDQAIFIERDYFIRMGRFREIPIMEEVDLLRRIRRNGDHICILREAVSTSPRRWEAEGPLYTTLRNQLLIFLFGLGVKPEKLAQLYRGART